MVGRRPRGQMWWRNEGGMKDGREGDAVMETDVHPWCWSGPTGPHRHPYMDTKLCTASSRKNDARAVITTSPGLRSICINFLKGGSTYLGSVIHLPWAFNLQPATDTRTGIFLQRGTDTNRRGKNNSYNETEENIENTHSQAIFIILSLPLLGVYLLPMHSWVGDVETTLARISWFQRAADQTVAIIYI